MLYYYILPSLYDIEINIKDQVQKSVLPAVLCLPAGFNKQNRGSNSLNQKEFNEVDAI